MLCLLLLPPLIPLASAQLLSGVPGSSALQSSLSGSHFCNQSFADANATLQYTWDPEVGASNDNISYFGTVYQPGNGQGYTELSLWFSPGDHNYTDDFKLGYDVCYMYISQLSFNTDERGVIGDATGSESCVDTFDQYCVNDLISLSNTFSLELVGSPTPEPNSNLTADSLPTVCSDLAGLLTQNFPNSCKVYMNQSVAIHVAGGLPGLGGPLTGPDSLVARSQCRSTDGYSLLWTQYGDNTYFNYVVANYIVAPLITVFMPIANVARPITLGFTKSFLTCSRTSNLRNGSEALPPIPSPTAVVNPYADDANSSSTSTSSSNNNNNTTTAVGTSPAPSRHDLSGGAIAGTVIGVLLALALLALLIFALFSKRARDARAKRTESTADPTGGYEPVQAKRAMAEAPIQHAKAEMGVEGARVEMSTEGDRFEMPVWKEAGVSELPAWRRSRGGVAELEGQITWSGE